MWLKFNHNFIEWSVSSRNMSHIIMATIFWSLVFFSICDVFCKISPFHLYMVPKAWCNRTLNRQHVADTWWLLWRCTVHYRTEHIYLHVHRSKCSLDTTYIYSKILDGEKIISTSHAYTKIAKYDVF